MYFFGPHIFKHSSLSFLLTAYFQVKFFDPFLQEEREVRAGRMECTMQNLADSLTTRTTQPMAAGDSSSSSTDAGTQQQLMDQLSTFMVYNMRRKVCGL